MSVMRGIGLKVASLAVFLAMASFVKSATTEVPAMQAAFFRSLFAIPVVVGYLLSRGELRHGLKMVRPRAHLIRGVLGAVTMMLGFTALSRLPLPDATAIGYARPLFIVLLSAVFLRERVRVFRFTAVAIGMVGVLIILSPRLTMLHGVPTSEEKFGAMAALLAAIIVAFIQLHLRTMVKTESTTSIVFWFSVIATIVTGLTFPLGWVMPSGWIMVQLVLAGFLGGFGQILLTASYRHAPASTLASFEYTSMVFAILVGYVFFSEVPTWMTLIGAAIIVASGLLVIHRERQLGLSAERLKKTSSHL
ncbi:DMT family transporter [Celeribacter marinus]|uniref:DMT family transporter n=1 Tax=Celeribacter marinus TaxID=1397108 RepID=UPI003F6BCCD9